MEWLNNFGAFTNYQIENVICNEPTPLVFMAISNSVLLSYLFQGDLVLKQKQK